MIGNIGTTLASGKINIARMHFGRESEGGTAISAVSVDATPTSSMIEKIESMPNILSVKLVRL